MRIPRLRFSTLAGLPLLIVALFLSQSLRVPRASLHVTERNISGIATASGAPARPRAGEAFTSLPLSFEPNLGQAVKEAKFVARGAGSTLFLTDTEVVLSGPSKDEGRRNKSVISDSSVIAHASSVSRSAVLRMRFAGANHASQIETGDELPGRSNYFVGKDPARWRTNIPNYANVRYRGIYPGIDAVYYGRQRELEYDFVVAPGADPETIRLDFAGADDLRLDESGNLLLRVGTGEIIQRAPVIYQEENGERQSINGRFAFTDEHQVGFDIGAYDPTKPLVIDPILSYSTYLGGNRIELGEGIAADSEGNVYVCGVTKSFDFPGRTTTGAAAAFVTKLSAGGDTILYSTILDGAEFLGADNDLAQEIALDTDGNAYVTGFTHSNDFPVTPGAFQTSLKKDGHLLDSARDAFVTKLDAAGIIVYSTYLGGHSQEIASGIAVDSDGRAYIVGDTNSGAGFPLKNEFQGNAIFGGQDAFLTVFTADGSELVYCTRFRGGSFESARGIAVDSAGHAYVVGTANGKNLPTRGEDGAAPFQPEKAGGLDGFVAKFNPDQAGDDSLIYATYLGGSNKDVAIGIAVDSSGRAYITGTSSSPDFPLSAATGASILDPTQVDQEAFVAELNASGTALVFSTFLGGSADDDGFGIALDSSHNIYITGQTDSSNFPLAQAFQSVSGGAFDAFVTKIAAGGTQILYSTYIGGSGDDQALDITVDRFANSYITGETRSTNFPTTTQALRPRPIGLPDAFIAKINDCAIDVTSQVRFQLGAVIFNARTGRFAQDVTITNISSTAISAQVALALDNLATTVALFNAEGATSCAEPGGSPFIFVDVGGNNLLSPNESVTVTLEFTNPNNANISFTTRLLAGSTSF